MILWMEDELEGQNTHPLPSHSSSWEQGMSQERGLAEGKERVFEQACREMDRIQWKEGRKRYERKRKEQAVGGRDCDGEGK